MALLVNNLGATTPLELQLAAKEAVTYVQATLKVRTAPEQVAKLPWWVTAITD